MSKPTAPEFCPACSAESVTHRAQINSWVCDKCSYVLGSDESPNGSTQPVGRTSSRDSVSNPDVDWVSQIAVADTAESNLVEALEQTETTAESVGLSTDQLLRAGELMATAWQTNFMHGRSQERTVGAVVYAASRETDAAVPPAMIADAIGVSKAAIKQTFQKVNRELELEIGPPCPRMFVEALRVEVGLPESVNSTARYLLKRYEPKGGNPVGIAGAAVYVVCEQTEDEITLKELATMSGLTKETVWRHTQKFG